MKLKTFFVLALSMGLVACTVEEVKTPDFTLWATTTPCEVAGDYNYTWLTPVENMPPVDYELKISNDHDFREICNLNEAVFYFLETDGFTSSEAMLIAEGQDSTRYYELLEYEQELTY